MVVLASIPICLLLDLHRLLVRSSMISKIQKIWTWRLCDGQFLPRKKHWISRVACLLCILYVTPIVAPLLSHLKTLGPFAVPDLNICVSEEHGVEFTLVQTFFRKSRTRRIRSESLTYKFWTILNMSRNPSKSPYTEISWIMKKIWPHHVRLEFRGLRGLKMAQWFRT